MDLWCACWGFVMHVIRLMSNHSQSIKMITCIAWRWFLTVFAVSDTSVAGIALRAPMRTGAGAGACACPVQCHAQTAGAALAALPVSLVTSSMVTIAITLLVCCYCLSAFRWSICLILCITSILSILKESHCSWRMMEICKNEFANQTHAATLEKEDKQNLW